MLALSDYLTPRMNGMEIGVFFLFTFLKHFSGASSVLTRALPIPWGDSWEADLVRMQKSVWESLMTRLDSEILLFCNKSQCG